MGFPLSARVGRVTSGNVLSTDSKLKRWLISISYRSTKFMWRISSTRGESAHVLRVLRRSDGFKIWSVEWAVGPSARSRAATVEDTTVTMNVSLCLKNLYIVDVTNVFPVSPGTPKKDNRSVIATVDGPTRRLLAVTSDMTEPTNSLNNFCC